MNRYDPYARPDPIRTTIAGPERLERLAVHRGRRDRFDPRPRRGFRLLRRLAENERVLHSAYRKLTSAVRRDRAISPAAEWLIDNIHVLDEATRVVRDGLPRSYYRELPKLTEGPFVGHPRVLSLMWVFVGHTDSRFDGDALESFVHAYQRESPLTIGELWALAIMLRLVLIENARRIAARVVGARRDRRAARELVDLVLAAGDVTADDMRLALRPYESRELAPAFAVELLQGLRDTEDRGAPVLAWLEERLDAQGTTPEAVVREVQSGQLADHATIGNIINSLRQVSAYDWATFFESVSQVESVLRGDPEKVYSHMDFATRDGYRHAVESIARGAGRPEVTIAEAVVQRASEAGRRRSGNSRARYLGYHLTGEGRRAFEKAMGGRVPAGELYRRAIVASGLTGFFGAIGLVSAVLVGVLLLVASRAGASAGALTLIGALSILPASELAIALLYRDLNQLLEPRRLPKLNLESGIPLRHATVVAVPCLLTSRREVRELVERLELHSLAFSRGHIAFALLSDGPDADEALSSVDEALVAEAAAGIHELNERYGVGPWGGARFLLFHRERLWNEGEQRWMGWERKRGKIHEFNQYLRGDEHTTFLTRHDGLMDPPPDVRFVITLDADTRLPPGAAHRLIGALAHPLNRAVHDPVTQRVIDGYAILQPRITPMLPALGRGSRYHRIYAGPTGIDPYASAVSDVYQDFFGEGSYVGKGIYDVDAFETSLSDRVPDNALLSHDLFEGSFARCGLVTDVELFDDFPSDYWASARRVHRWARGDWQLLPWIVSLGRRSRGLTGVNRWKMIDNLRRSLVPLATLALLVGGWLALPITPLVWTAVVVTMIGMPLAVPVLAGLVPRRRKIAKRAHVRGVAEDVAQATTRVALMLVFLVNRTVIMVDAIMRTLVRLVRRRRLLEWVPAANAGSGTPTDTKSAIHGMGRALATTAAIAALVARVRPDALLTTGWVFALWCAAPLIALWLSAPASGHRVRRLDAAGRRAFRAIARRTWVYFETFVTAEDHDLPPDNIQEDPELVVAHRTSPTNVGLYLLAVMSARSFAWIGLSQTLGRVGRTMQTLERMERFHGHFFNWYATETLKPLNPRYVSTVDSGNLAGHLWAVASALRSMTGDRWLTAATLDGVADAVELARAASAGGRAESRTSTVSLHDLESAFEVLTVGLSAAPTSATEWARCLDGLHEAALTLADVATVLADEEESDASAELARWSQTIVETVAADRDDLQRFMPWVARIGETPEGMTAAVAEAWHALVATLDAVPAVSGIADLADDARSAIGDLRTALGDAGGTDGIATRLSEIETALARGRAAAAEALADARALASRAEALVDAMDFAFLYDSKRKLFPIGYHVTEQKSDTGYYDLLASEARLASLVAIAKGDVPVEHWFRLGRAIAPVERGSALLSWSGSMFEYLMPSLVMQTAPGTMLEQTQRRIVARQIQYGGERGVPWGVSESAYNARDLHLTYQYSHFGVPGLGLTRGLSEELVVAPYATALAAMVRPVAALSNFARLEKVGARGRMGFYEALDYTPSRVPEGSGLAVVKAYMAHHQGMSIVAIHNVMYEGRAQRWFHAVPAIGANALLLQERIPRDVAVARPRPDEVEAIRHVREIVPPVIRRFTSPHERAPRTHLLSNGRYTVMVTNAGSGYSRWNGLAVSRWREDATRDGHGSFIYVRDVESGAVWSTGYQPTTREPEAYAVSFAEDRAEFRRRDESIETTMDVLVTPEDDGELRRVTVRNLGTRTREIELTTYTEVVLAPPAADEAHPAFQNLFVQTEVVPGLEALLATRRPRSEDEPTMWVTHVEAVEGQTVGGVQWETDRARFLDRGRGVREPSCIVEGRPLSNSTGAVLDPILSLRRTVRLRPGESARVTFSTLVTGTRDQALALADKYRDPAAYERAAALAWTQAQVQLQHLAISPDEAHLFQRLASRLLYLDPTLRPPSVVIARNTLGQQALWNYGISGDLPIALVRIDQLRDRDLIRQLMRAHEYWGLKGLHVDLVVVNEHPASYGDELQQWLDRIVRVTQAQSGHEAHAAHGDIHVLRSDTIPAADLDLLRSAARFDLASHQGSLTEQMESALRDEMPPTVPVPLRPVTDSRGMPPPRPPLEFFNGLGGFAEDGREYVIVLGENQWTPAPWINVIANPRFGFQVSESGAGFTWSVNSRENRLTPWSNDPVSDPPGEVLYVRDEETGDVWTPTPLPIRESAPYVITHGQGWSKFEHTSHGITLELLQYVPLDDDVKISRLTLRNDSGRTRRLSVTAYAEWVLGAIRSKTAPFVTTMIEPATGAMVARNPWNAEFAGRVAFADLAGRQVAWTGDRTEFLGRNGSVRTPAGMAPDVELSGAAGAGFDPCAVLRQNVRLPADGVVEVVFTIGQADGEQAVRAAIERTRARDLDRALEEIETWWEETLGAVQVRTPDASMTVLLNRWLLYQALVCRVWARSAFYQSGGAYGFRDQLQDVMALTVVRPEIARQHILRAASRQYPEGDVQHWWHAPSGRGVRTRITDDRLWLPYAVVHYVRTTGDTGVLDEPVPFLEGRALEDDEQEAYYEPSTSATTETLYEHCARAIDISLAFGRHGLPLIGAGDWNDGMNRVGHEGAGESVWLAWFLLEAIAGFAPLADGRGDADRVERWTTARAAVQRAVHEHGWDGDWFRRAYYDDGTPLGSAANDECRIDSIVQSWAVISGGADEGRGEQAMKAVEQYLVRRGDGLVLLFTPPFDRTSRDPGYIKGYVPGVRENGGQYTHGAIWSVIAFAELGDGEKAVDLFSILNPVNHGSTRAGIHRYKVEPYVSVADVYAEPPHTGRGGWTWYTGSAGWMYRAGIEWILGFRVVGDHLEIDPCIPRDWPGFEIDYRHGTARYRVEVTNPAGVMRGVRSIEVDGQAMDIEDARAIRLVDDGAHHIVQVELG